MVAEPLVAVDGRPQAAIVGLHARSCGFGAFWSQATMAQRTRPLPMGALWCGGGAEAPSGSASWRAATRMPRLRSSRWNVTACLGSRRRMAPDRAAELQGARTSGGGPRAKEV